MFLPSSRSSKSRDCFIDSMAPCSFPGSILLSVDLVAMGNSDFTVCSVPHCLQQSCRGSIRCRSHTLLTLQQRWHNPSFIAQAVDGVSQDDAQAFIEKQWHCDGKFLEVLVLLNNLDDPGWADETGYRPKILILDTEWTMRAGKPHEVTFLDFRTVEMILGVFIQYERGSTVTDRIRDQCTPVEFSNLVKVAIHPRDVILEWSIYSHVSLDLRMVQNVFNDTRYSIATNGETYCFSPFISIKLGPIYITPPSNSVPCNSPWLRAQGCFS